MTATPQTGDPPSASRRGTIVAEPPEAIRHDGIRDTIESIVVAFILAFVFRAFMIEAFVIPTGSMAPGLHGAHAQHRCTLCSYSFSYGLREEIRLPTGQTQTGSLSHVGFSVKCPNCGFDGGGNSKLNTPENPVVPNGGDRILVFKWPYDLGGDLLGPKRWDVVVFKDPEDGDTNFIKRLIGLPGEALQILDGDIYTAPIDVLPEAIRNTLSISPPVGNPETRRLTQAQLEQLAGLLRIQRKTRMAQDSLWMLHYDHDFIPDPVVTASPGFTPPAWKPQLPDAGSWDARHPIVRFTPKTEGEQWLHLVGKPIVDSYGYNDLSANRVPYTPRYVGDVQLKFVLTPLDMGGYMSFYLSKGPDEFIARIESDGRAVLQRIGPGGVMIELAHGQTAPLYPGRSLSIEFENLDYRVALRIDEAEVLATTDSQYAPNPVELLRTYGRDDSRSIAKIRIGASGMPLEIRHLTVYRDVYYRSDCYLDERDLENRPNPYANQPGWGTTLNPILLRKDPPDYYCLGDNSPQSKDARLWWQVCKSLEQRGDYKYGTVPGDQLIGRAFFVYWPSGYRLSRDTPAVIPNVGRMRIIR